MKAKKFKAGAVAASKLKSTANKLIAPKKTKMAKAVYKARLDKLKSRKINRKAFQTDVLKTKNVNVAETSDSGVESVRLGGQVTRYTKQGIDAASGIKSGASRLNSARKSLVKQLKIKRYKKQIQKKKMLGLKKRLAGRKLRLAKPKIPLRLKAGKALAAFKPQNVKKAAKATFKILKKPAKLLGSGAKNIAGGLKDKALDMSINTGETTDSGLEGIRMGAQTVRYAKNIKTGITKAVKAPAKLRKSVQRTVRNVKRSVQRVQKGVRTTAKVAKRTVQTVQKAAQLAMRIAQMIARMIRMIAHAVRIAAQAIAQAASAAASALLAALPYILIGAGIVVVIMVLIQLSSSVISSIPSAIDGVAGWLFHDEGEAEKNTDELIKKVDKYCRQIDEVYSQTKQEAIAFVNSAADDDYLGLNGSVYYPASSAKSSVTAQILNTKIDDIEFISILFVQKQKEKNEGVDEEKIYDIKLEKSDMEDFFGNVNESQKYIDFFETTTTGLACPGQNCKIEYRNDRCAYYYTDEGYIRYYCAGHPYCDYHHNMIDITFKQNEDIMDELGFDDDDKQRVQMAKGMIQSLMDSGGTS